MKIFKMLFNGTIWIISFLIPKSRKYVVIGGWQGKRYADNSRGMFEYLDSHKKELGIERVFWYTKNKEIYEFLKNRGKDVLYGYNARSVYWHFRSKIHIIDQSTHDILHIFSVRCIRINLWHGIPLKKIGNFLKHEKKAVWSDKWYIGGGWADQYILATSELAASILKKAMGVKKTKCIIASYPRNAKLYNCGLVFRKNKQFCVFYLPTFRNGKEVNPLLKANLADINQQLASKNIVMYIKPHFEDSASWNIVTHLSNINILDPMEDVYDWLHKADLLITDYSSVMFDYMLTGRPILFFVYDLDYYENEDRGFILPYNKVTPGKKVYSVGHLVDETMYIYDNYEGYIRQYKKQYERVNTKMNQYLDKPNYSKLLDFWKN